MVEPTTSGRVRRLGCSGVPLGFAVLLVPLATWPSFVDPFVSVKWYAVTAVAAGWLLSERLLCRGWGVPSFLRRTWIGWAALAAWVVLGSLRHGLSWATGPLVAHASFAALALASYWCFRRTGLWLGALHGSVVVAALVIVTTGLLQMAGLRPLPWLTGGDQRSATFGNVNMAAQFVGLALAVLLSRSSTAGGALRRAVSASVLAFAGLGYIILAGTRSVALALAAATVVLAIIRRSRGAMAYAAVASVAAVIVLLVPPPPPDSQPQEVIRASKATSARLRIAIWSDTLDLVRDHPLGVGAGNFEHAFMPYALAGRSRPGEQLVFRSPHNDYLRFLAEEGVPGAAVLLSLLLLLLRELKRSASTETWRSDGGALLASSGVFLAVEAFFQFPFEMPFPALLAAVLLGLALAAVEPPRDTTAGLPHRPVSYLGDGACVLVAGLLLTGTARLAEAEHLSASRRGDRPSLERSCRLDPRRLEACVEAAWHDSLAGRHGATEAALTEVLERSPAYAPALKLRAQDLLAAGHRDEACRYARAYDALFAGASSLRPLLSRECMSGGGTGPS